MEMELAQNAENTTNLLTDNALHSTKIQNVKSGIKKKFVNAVTIQTSTTSITTIFALKISLNVKSLIFKVVTVLNVIPDIPCITVNVFCRHQLQRVRHPDLLND